MSKRNTKKRRQSGEQIENYFKNPFEDQVKISNPLFDNEDYPETGDSEGTVSEDEIEQIFFGKGTEELTNQLVEELVGKGWERKRLVEYKKQGFRYNRKRNSMFDPDVHFENFENIQ